MTSRKIILNDELPQAFQVSHKSNDEERSIISFHNEEEKVVSFSKIKPEGRMDGEDCEDMSFNISISSTPNSSLALFSPASFGDQSVRSELNNDVQNKGSDKRSPQNRKSFDGYVYYILLIRPQDRQFELLHIITHECQSSSPQEVNDILPLIAQHTAEQKFREQKHIGLCHLPLHKQNIKNEKNQHNMNKKESSTLLRDQGESHYSHHDRYDHDDHGRTIIIRHGDILVAIPEGYTKEFCQLAGKIIFEKNPRLRNWIRKSLRKRSTQRQNNKMKKRNTSLPLQESKQKERTGACALNERNSDLLTEEAKQRELSSLCALNEKIAPKLPQETKQRELSSPCTHDDSMELATFSASSPNSIMTPLIVNSINGHSKSISPDTFFTPEEKKSYQTHKVKQLQLLDDVVSAVTINSVSSSTMITDKKVRTADDLAEVEHRNTLPIRVKSFHDRKEEIEQPIQHKVLVSSPSLLHQLYPTKETLKINRRNLNKQKQLKSQKNVVILTLASGVIFVFHVFSKVTGSFRIVNKICQKEAHLDLDGIIQVIILMFFFSAIQANWKYIQRQYNAMLGYEKAQRSSRRLIHSKSGRISPTSNVAQ